eukprot:4026689-Ditylum_brightwellii.AAC.1
MEEAKEVGEKRKAKGPDTVVSKSSKNGVILNVIYNSATDITEQIKRRGETALDHETSYKTVVKIAWTLP